jgi:hypothetical protein
MMLFHNSLRLAIIPLIIKLDKKQEKLIFYGKIILFILLYILNVLIVKKIFGQLELPKVIEQLVFLKMIL